VSWSVKSVMTTHLVCLAPDTPFKECVDMIRLHRIGALPVVDDSGRLLGILSKSDLLRKAERSTDPDERKATARTAGEAMTRTVITSTEESSLTEAARLMHRAAIRHLPITDTDGKLVGMISRADLLKVFLRTDESIRHEITEVLLPRAFGIPSGGLEVEVREGIVHIGGEVESSGTARLIVAFIDRIEGVVGVESAVGHRRDDGLLRGPAVAGSGSGGLDGVLAMVLPGQGGVPFKAGR
jgi:CBS domain-containing protein